MLCTSLSSRGTGATRQETNRAEGTVLALHTKLKRLSTKAATTAILEVVRLDARGKLPHHQSNTLNVRDGSLWDAYVESSKQVGKQSSYGTWSRVVWDLYIT